MTRKSKPPPDDRDQFARFTEVAKRIENPDAKKAFEEALGKIIRGSKRKIPNRAGKS